VSGWSGILGRLGGQPYCELSSQTRVVGAQRTGGGPGLARGIGAISDANFYTSSGTHYVLGTLHTWGWITLILGVIQLTAAFSLFGGGAYGRVIGVVAATLGALGALLAIGTVPFWSLGVFAICLWVAYGLLVFGEEEQTHSGV
jgi:hypothetical protein